MRLSFFCAHCGTHLNSGDHRKCKRILRKKHMEERAANPKEPRPHRHYGRERHNAEAIEFAHRFFVEEED